MTQVLTEENVRESVETLTRTLEHVESISTCVIKWHVSDTLQLGHQVLTEENVRALRESVKTLTRTLEHVESISGDVGGLTGDGRVKANVRQLIEALSRITSD